MNVNVNVITKTRFSYCYSNEISKKHLTKKKVKDERICGGKKRNNGEKIVEQIENIEKEPEPS